LIAPSLHFHTKVFQVQYVAILANETSLTLSKEASAKQRFTFEEVELRSKDVTSSFFWFCMKKNLEDFFKIFFDIKYERFNGVPWHRVWTIQSCFMTWGIIDSNCSMTWRLNDQFWTLFHDKEYERSKLFHDLKCERFKTVPWLKVWTVQSYFMRWTIKACFLSSTICFFHPHDSCVKGIAKTSFVRCNH
jgi:hypothetical protein